MEKNQFLTFIIININFIFFSNFILKNDLNDILFNNKMRSNFLNEKGGPSSSDYFIKSKLFKDNEFKERTIPIASNLPKLVNKNFLNLLYLSIYCLYEIMNCIQQHLVYVKTNDYKTKNQDLITLDTIINSKDNDENFFEQEAQFLVYLHEFLNFEDLKQSFSIIIRFYCYNEHVYTSPLIKAIMLSNENFLKTFELISQYLKESELKGDIVEKDHESDLELSATNASSKSFTLVSTLIEKHKSIQDVYNLFYNADTSYMLQKVKKNYQIFFYKFLFKECIFNFKNIK